MADKVAQLLSLPQKDTPNPEASPSIAAPPLIERETNIMTKDKLDFLRESFSFPFSVQIRLPKPDSSWLYFKVRSGKSLLRGYSSNVKGWKKKIFFISGDDWEFPSGTSRQALQQTACLVFYRAGETLGNLGLDLSEGNKGDNPLIGSTTPVLGDDGESHHSRGEPLQARVQAWRPSQIHGCSISLDLMANPGAVLRPKALMLGNASVVEKILEGVILLADKEKVNKLSFDQVTQSFFTSSVRVVEFVTFKYFGEGFYFYKRQLAHHHPNLGIDLDGMGLNHDLLKEKDEAEEEEGDKEKEGSKEKGEVKGDTLPFPP
ncbi:hypothetical protein Acr_05g0012410 [Actinidia rufa]|uniref:Uncharacterized protein n=1 Tax=Actinidia rufa TaxID=165716 RepID=A0A7J0EMR0_9ERIC|nr:hypothetical protein Acr_05g0012410 [Actinidia rufa]